jgi:hypothetical protein
MGGDDIKPQTVFRLRGIKCTKQSGLNELAGLLTLQNMKTWVDQFLAFDKEL